MFWLTQCSISGPTQHLRVFYLIIDLNIGIVVEHKVEPSSDDKFLH